MTEKDLLPAPKTADEAFKLADLMAHCQMIPKAFQGRPADIVVAMMWSHSLGIPIVQGLQYIAVINGKPSMYGDGLLAVVMSSGQCTDFREELKGEGNNLTAVCTVKRRGLEAPIVGTFSMEDARVAGLLGKPGPWKQYPKRMLKMRARAFALRDAFPDILSGMSSAEEMADVEGVAVEKPEDVEPVTERKMPSRKKTRKVDAPVAEEPKPVSQPQQETSSVDPVGPDAPEVQQPEQSAPTETVKESDPVQAPEPQASESAGFTHEDALIADINTCSSRTSLIALWHRLTPEDKSSEIITRAFADRQKEINEVKA